MEIIIIMMKIITSTPIQSLHQFQAIYSWIFLGTIFRLRLKAISVVTRLSGLLGIQIHLPIFCKMVDRMLSLGTTSNLALMEVIITPVSTSKE
jgi:hypothetical protein